jgi:putative ABC transport system permease protein
MRSLSEHIELHHLDMNMFTAIFGVFAGIGLLLASMGLYAVVSHSVSQRTHEIGVRKALGASPLQICGLVFGRAMLQLAVGLGVGLLLALSATRILGALLVETEPNDPLTFVVALAVLTISGLLGCAIPVQRAVNVDPMTALRAQ